jgi:2'-hydroxyisoflavone reductase
VKLLVLGGTHFVGRHIVKQALGRRHEVTLFNRGQTNAGLYPDLEQLRGDRDGGLQALAGRVWDAVVDVNGYVPRHVRDSALLLRDAVQHYVYVSTGAVYAIPFPTNGDERTPVRTLPAGIETEDTDRYYGELKALCEQAAEAAMPGRTLVLRLGLVAGPYDPTDRASYWITRVARGGQVLAPGKPHDRIQVIDARDFAAFVVRAIEQQLTGTYNTTGESMTWQAWFDAFKAVSGSDATYTWINDRQFLREHIKRPTRPYGALPLFMPPEWGDWWTCNSDRAQALGLTYRPATEIARDVLEWDAARPPDEPRAAGLPPEDEQAILERWRAQAAT